MSEEPANSAPEKPVSLWRRLHQSHANQRRIETLAAHLDRLTPRNARLLDVGCGDGRVGDTLQRRRPDIRYEGTEVVVREGSAIPVRLFDGLHIPPIRQYPCPHGNRARPTRATSPSCF